MAVPKFTKADFKAIIPAPNASLCRKIVLSFVRLPTLVFQLVDYLFADDMTLSDDFKGSVGVDVGALSAPTGVTASDGTFTDHVQIQWIPVSGATYYQVFRGPTADPADVETDPIGTVTSPSNTFSDSSAGNDIGHFYFVKAVNATSASGLSLPDKGFTDTTGGGGSGASGQTTLTTGMTWTVPAGVTSIQAEVWGAGGGGGGSGCPFCIVGMMVSAGGGGGSGEYLKIRSIPVVPGQILSIINGLPGDGGSDAYSTGGSAGEATILRRGADEDLVTSNGGQGGQPGGDASKSGAGGTGGSGGSNTVGVLDGDSASGDTGGDSAARTALPTWPAAGTGAAAVGGSGSNRGKGGNGGSFAGGSAGERGRATIVWPSP